MPNTPHNRAGQMKSLGSVTSAAGAFGPIYSPGDLVVFGPPGSFSTDGRHAVIPGLQLGLSTPPVAVDWGTAGMVVLHQPKSALPEVCILVKGFVGWATAAAVYPIDDWTRVIPGVAVDPDWPSETTGSSGQ